MANQHAIVCDIAVCVCLSDVLVKCIDRNVHRRVVEDVTLKGTIKMLSKSPSAAGDEEENTVRLLTKIDGQMRSISLHLPPDKHALACNAYRDDKEVCISGTIDKSGKYWFLQK